MTRKTILIKELGRSIRRMKRQPGSVIAAQKGFETALKIQAMDMAEGKLKPGKSILFARAAADGKSA